MTHKPWFALLMAGLLAGLALMLAVAPALANASIIYVDADAAGPAHDGLSWTTAYTTVQDALTWTNAHTITLYEIWVAEGVYYPDEGSGHVNDAITETFVISYNNVQMYGGFGGYGISETLRTQRDWTVHPTVLSGDIDANDWNTDTNHIAETWNDLVGSNAYHVLYLDGVTNQPITATTTLDGLIITAGQANGTYPNYYGGGLYCDGSGSGKACSPTLTNVTFSGNSASNYGGGMVNEGYYGGVSSPTLTNVTFSGNSAEWGGGGMYNDGAYGGVSSPTLTNVTFSGNSASDSGGGMYNDGYDGASSPTLTNVTFSGNSANYGGGMVNGGSSPTLTNVTFSGNKAQYGGGMFNFGLSGVSSPTLTNVTFSGNSADSGGGLFNWGSSPTLTNVTFSGNSASEGGGGMVNAGYYDGVSSPTLTNVTFSGNSAGNGGGMVNGGYYGGVSSPTLVNTILWGNVAISGSSQISNTGLVTLTISYSDIDEDGYAGSHGNIRQDPLFAAPITATAAPTTTGNYRLNFGSPAIDAGSNLSVTVGTDLDGNPRIVGGVVDMGAYEAPVYYTLTVNIAGSGSGIVTSAPAGITTSVGISVSHFVSGTAVTLTATANAGSIFAGWSGDTDCADGSVTMNADKSCTATFKFATTTTLTSSPNPSLYGQAVMFTATVTSTLGTPGGGTVAFQANGVAIAGCEAQSLTGGQATCVTEGLTTTVQPITATYSGDAAYNSSVSAALFQGVYTRPAVDAGDYHTCGLKAGGALACWGYNNYGQTTAPSPNTNWVQVSASEFHTCGLKADGTLACWGWNDYGRTTVPSPNTNWVQVSAGGLHTCGLKADGTLACWGYNSNGQTKVPDPNTNWVQVSAGYWHTCGLKADGALACWGSGGDGQTTVPSPNTNWVQVSAGYFHTCGLKADGALACWGWDYYGQTTVPTTTVANTSWVQVSAGGLHTCGLKADGTLACWGNNDYGQRAVPSPNTNWVQVSAGGYHTCGLKADGTLACWGSGGDGQAPVISLTPITLPNATVGAAYTQAITATGTAGATPPYTLAVVAGATPPGLTLNANGDWSGAPTALGVFTFTVQARDANDIAATQDYTLTVDLAATTTTLTSSPNPSLYEQAVTFTATVTSTLGTPGGGTVAFQANGVAIAGCEAQSLAGGQATCVTAALTATVQPITATYSGDATYNASASAALFQGVYARPAVEAGEYHTCGLKAGGTLACWGLNDYGQTAAPSPNTNWVQVSAGDSHTCGLKADGTLACWGGSIEEQTSVPSPNTNWVQVNAGYKHTCGLKADGTLACWGYNDYGQTDVPSPNTNWVQVSGGAFHTCGLKADGTLACWGGWGQMTVPSPNTNWVQVSAGGYQTCGLKADGTLACWGDNDYGQSNVPSPNTNWTQVSAGDFYICGLKADGTLACWGDNTYGQRNVPSPNTNWVQVSAGASHTCGLKADGTLACWGQNNHGQAPVIGLTPITLPNATVGAAYTQAITATGTAGATPPYTLAVIAGATPSGLTLNANGVWSGAPTAAGVFTFTVQARDANDIAATRGYTLRVTANTTTTLTSSPNPSLYGQAVTFTATVTSTIGTPGGTVQFYADGATLGSAVGLSSGAASTSTSALAVGAHAITAAYSGNAAYTASASGVYTQTVNKANTATSVTSSPNPSLYGQAVTFTATVTSTIGTPGGTVQFYADGAALGSAVALSSGAASMSTSALAAGAHAITAAYSGDATYNVSTSNVYTQTVNQANTTTSVTSSPNPSMYGQAVTFTATVTSTLGAPSGTVQFYADGTALGSAVALSSGAASTSTSALAGGAHAIIAAYSGDANYTAGASGVYTQTVNQANTTTSVTSSPNPSLYGQAVAFTATVTSTVGTPGGTVQFYADGVMLGSAVGLSSGAASVSTSALAAGAHAITVTYSGDATCNASTSGVYTQSVTRLSTFNLTAIPNALLANGVDTSTLSVMAKDQDGSGAPFAGYVVTISWTLGFDQSPVTVTLDAQGIATTTYTAGSTPGVDVLTATIRDAYQALTATTAITLKDNLLVGSFRSQYGATITYTLIVTNAHPTDVQANVIISGSIPVNTQFVSVNDGTHVATGGDYGWGYAASPVIASLPPGQSVTLRWTVRPILWVGDILNVSHGASDTAVLRLALADRVYRLMLQIVMFNGAL